MHFTEVVMLCEERLAAGKGSVENEWPLDKKEREAIRLSIPVLLSKILEELVKVNNPLPWVEEMNDEGT